MSRKELNVVCICFALIIIGVKPTWVATSIFIDSSNTFGLSLESSFSDDPVMISSDADFQLQGWPGNGTGVNPYAIENLEIVSDSPCISISDVTAHYRIKNCSLTSVSEASTYGISLYNASNGKVDNCSITKKNYGIYISYSRNCTVSNTTIEQQSERSIYISMSPNSVLLQNNLTSRLGVYIRSSNSSVIESNSISSSHLGALYLSNSSECRIRYNHFKGGGLDFSTHFPIGWRHEVNDNTINGKSVAYILDESNSTINSDSYGQIILMNCSGFSVVGSVVENDKYMITIAYSRNCTITDVRTIGSVFEGFLIAFSEDCHVIDCQISDSDFGGIEIVGSINCTIVRNEMRNSSFSSISVLDSWGCNVINNLIEGDSLYGFYFTESSFCEAWNNTVQITGFGGACASLDSSTNITVKNGVLEGGSRGVRLFASDNCTLINLTISKNDDHGVWLQQSRHFKMTNCTVTDSNGPGLQLTGAPMCELGNNTVRNNYGDGILLETGGGHGNYYYSDYCTLVNNTVILNNRQGIDLRGNYNLLYGNRIGWNEYGNALDDGYGNQWDNGIDLGNYWSDYYGIGEYEIPEGSVDRFPMIYAPIEYTPPLINHPPDILYEVNSEGHFITWSPYDENPSIREVWRNSTLLSSGQWWGGNVTIGIDDLQVGIYNYTLVVYDIFGTSAGDSVLVTVFSPVATTSTTTTSRTLTTTTNTTDDQFTLDPRLIGLGFAGGTIMVCFIILYVRKQTD